MWVKLYIDCKYVPCFLPPQRFCKGYNEKQKYIFFFFFTIQLTAKSIFCIDLLLLEIPFFPSPTCFPLPSPLICGWEGFVSV